MKWSLKFLLISIILIVGFELTATEYNKSNSEKARIAILNWEIRDERIKEEADAIAEKIRELFVNTSHYTVVGRTLTNMILQEWERLRTGHTEENSVVKIGELYNVKMIVTGKLSRFQSGGWQVSCVTLDAETGVTKNSKTVVHKGDFFGLISEKVPSMAIEIISALTGKNMAIDKTDSLSQFDQGSNPIGEAQFFDDTLDVLVLSTGDADRADVLKMIVLDELGKDIRFHLIDYNKVPEYTTKYKYGFDSIEVEEFSNMIRNAGIGPTPQIIVKANIKTIGETKLKYYGRCEILYTSSIFLEAILTSNNHVIAKPLAREVKFSDLNMYDNIRKVAQPMSAELAHEIGSFVNSFKKKGGVY